MIEIKNGIYLKIDKTSFLNEENKINLQNSEIFNSNELTFLNDEDLHITLCSNIEYKPFEKKLSKVDLNQFKIPELLYGKEHLITRDISGKKSLIVPVINQYSLRVLMDKIFESVGLVYPENYRYYHVTIANNGGGNKYDSIGNVLISDVLPENDKSDIFFDMDGVLADFDAYVSQDELVSKYQKNLYEKYPETKLLDIDEIKLLCKNDEDLKKLYKPLRERIFELANKEDFFLNLPLKEGAKDMLIKAMELSGKRPNILTSPMMNNHCAQEKFLWLHKHFFGLYDNVYITKNKDKLVRNESDLLIDDRSKYCELFESAGGKTIKHVNSFETIKKLIEIYI